MSTMTTQAKTFTMNGTGLITGLPVTATIEQGQPGQGIVFIAGGARIPARLESIVSTDRGVTLGSFSDGKPTGITLSIVEHVLCAASLAGLDDLVITVEGAPELPVLDGSAKPWLDAFKQHFGIKPVSATRTLRRAVCWGANKENDSKDATVYALPSDHFGVSYAVHFEGHRDLEQRWVRWDAQSDVSFETLASARTFGYVRELPVLQARGLAKGVSAENTVGITDDGQYTDALRFDDEPVFHKVLDLIGDLTLAGINPLSLKAHVFAIRAGHTSHTAFARELLKAI